MIQFKRIYDSVTEDDGYRVRIDRLWPRGFSKEDAKVDLWMKVISTSTELRKWLHHDPDKWMEVQQRYKDELVNKIVSIDHILNVAKVKKDLTLLFSAKDR